MEETRARIIRRYRRIAAITIGAVVFLILVGGIVRSTGAGMGCPDWPTCFGRIIPPTDVSQLPPNYQEIYQHRGYADTEFNPVKTWIEYINRLVGALIGLLAIATALAAWPYRKLDKRVFALSSLALLLIVLQGGLGALVVRSNLAVNMVSLHMLLAIVCLMALIFALMLSWQGELRQALSGLEVNRNWWILGGGCVALLLVQVLLGTQVREQVDEAIRQLGYERRPEWIASLGQVYVVHRYAYYLLVTVVLVWAVKSKPFFAHFPAMKWMMAGLVGLIGAEVVMGISMHHFSIPAFIQPLHLLFAVLLLAGSFTILGMMYIATRLKPAPARQQTVTTA
ncbi:MAG: heme A synthase [Bacteroidetes bacterium]|nr:MAG: heme A synthase [Bacteroidota bacterium]